VTDYKELYEKAADSFVALEEEYSKLKAQPKEKEVVVGLSDEQIHDFYLQYHETDFIRRYKEWAKTKTFVQPNESLIADNLALAKELEQLKAQQWQPNREEIERLESLNQTLHDCLEEQLKAQQWQPNWDDAPEWSNWLAMDADGSWAWYATKPNPTLNYFSTNGRYARITIPKKEWEKSLQQRPTPPAPSVESEQVWKYVKSGKLYLIIAVGNMKGDEDEAVCFPDWIDSVTYQCQQSGRIYTRPLEGFLAKFEQVQS
jgi:hypothetical protein